MAKKRNKKKNVRNNGEALNANQENKSKEPKIVTSLVGTINEVLNEDVEEINEEQPEAAAEEVIAEEPKARTNKGFVALGIIIVVLAVIGLISTVNFTCNTASDIINQTALKQEIAQFVFPVVTANPPEFTDASELPSSTVINAAIWKVIFDGNTSNYETLYNYYMYVPEIDVEHAVRSLYGNGAKIEHQSIINLDYNFEYDAESKRYLVPISPRYTAYTPSISNITSVGDIYSATVEYIPVTAHIPGVEVETEPDKTMVYTISISRNVKTILSISYIQTDDKGHIF